MKTMILTALAATTLLSTPVLAQNHDHHAMMDHSMHMMHTAHAPVGTTPSSVMGNHNHGKGQWMASYNFMSMNMGGNRNGTNSLSPEEVITFANPNLPPANLRVVPTDMTMNMHMGSIMYGLTNDVTLMVMGSYLDNEMDHITFNGAGNARIGTFTTKSSGFGDTSITALFPIMDRGNQSLNGRLGLSLPTGSIDEEDDVLTPMSTRPTLRLPYAMQLGTGTYDALPGLTYTYAMDDWQFGADYNARIHMGRNNEGYTRGDKHQITTWAGYAVTPKVGVNTSLTFKTEGKIDGADTQIAAPVQTADPSNYGGEKINLGLGLGWDVYEGNIFKANASVPLYQNLNGPQMEDDYSFSIGWQKTF